jgi:hypothetical protein
VVQRLDDASGPEVVSGHHLGPPLWDGATVILPLLETANVASLPEDVRLLPPAYPEEQIAAAALTAGGRTVTFVNEKGDIYVQDSATGAVERRIPGPHDLSVNTAQSLSDGMAAIDSGRGLVAIIDNGVARISDAGSGALVARLPGAKAFVAFSGPRLLVQRADGRLEVWNARGSERQRVLLGDQSYGVFFPVADSRGELVARQRSDSSVVITDLGSGASLATIPAPAPASLGLKLGLTFSPDGGALVTVVQTIEGTTPKILERGISDQALVHAACAAAGRNLTPAEWRTFVGTRAPGDLRCR